MSPSSNSNPIKELGELIRNQDLWVKAKRDVEPCLRCEDWSKKGLSSRCPVCDMEILAKYEELVNERNARNHVS